MSGFHRVTVAGPERRVDLALPGGAPVGALLPQLVRLCGTEPDGLEPARWLLSRLDGAALAPERSLDSAGVADGDILMLSRDSARVRPAFVEDVRGAIEDHVDEAAWRWAPSTTLGFGLLLAVLGPGALILLAGWPSGGPFAQRPGQAAFALAAALLAVAGAWGAHARDLVPVAHVVLVTGCLWGGVAAASAGAASPSAAPLALAALGAVGALAVAALGWWLLPFGLPYVLACAVAAAACAVVSAATLVDPGGLQGIRAVSVLLVLGVGVVPRMAMTLGGVAGLDYEVRASGRVPVDRFDERLKVSDELLLGGLVGIGVAATAAVTALTRTHAPRDLALGGVVALALLLRARLFDRTRHILPLRVAGVAALGTVAVTWANGEPGLQQWVPVAALAAAVGLAVVSGIPLPDVPRARLRRLLNGVDVVTIVAMCVVSASALGLFDLIARLGD